MTTKVFFFIAIFALVSCSENQESLDTTEPVIEPSENRTPEYSFKAIYYENIGWGYQIYLGSTLKIDQKHVPAVPGIQGFESKGKAEIAAKFVIEKMKQGNDRPSVTPLELDSIGAFEFTSYEEEK